MPTKNFTELCLDYILRGYKIISYDKKSKAPNTKNWGDTNLDVDTINKIADKANIGIITGSRSNGLLDIDADSEDSKTPLDLFLPATNMVFGRKTSKRSHRFYLDPSNTIKSKKYSDPIVEEGGSLKKVLFEIRTEGENQAAFQTMIPPSVHPNGEILEWESFDTPTTIEPAEFVLKCGVVAAATLLRRHFGSVEGSRHELAGALSGWLYKMKWTADDAANLIAYATTSAQDYEKEIDDRIRFVNDTYSNIENGREIVTGFKRVALLIGEPAADAICEWLQLTQDDLIIPDRPTDESNAELFRSVFGDEIMWVEQQQSWYVWVGTHWQRDDDLLVVGKTHDLVEAMRQDALQIIDSDERTRMLKWVYQCEQYRRIESVAHASRSYLSVSLDNLDQQHNYINFLNGTYDISTDKLLPHDPNHKITKIIPFNYNPDAKAPRFEQFLLEIFNNDTDLIKYVLKALGYCMTGSVQERAFFIFYGDGNNGKSTLTGLMRRIIGEYSGVVPAESLMVKRSSGHTDELAAMAGRRLVLINETAQGHRLDSALIKTITGGEDSIRVRQLYQRSFELKPTFKLVLSTNYKPNVSDMTGFWKRVKLVPFSIQIAPENIDKNIMQKLIFEVEGVIALLITGARKWFSEGLNDPDIIKEAVEEYKQDQDQMLEFVNEKVVRTGDKADRTPTGEIYFSYANWADYNGHYKLPRQSFTEQFSKTIGYKPISTRINDKFVKTWPKIKLIP